MSNNRPAVGRVAECEPPPPGMRRFGVLHGAHTSLEMIKLAIGVFVAAWISRAPFATQPYSAGLQACP
jgi:hypothetical protein